MANTILGSARIDERGRISGGSKGDQKQSSTPDYSGEVSMQSYYTHSKGWNVIRPNNTSVANKIAKEMKDACNNKNIGYNQDDRYGVISNVKKGLHLKDINTKCNADCSSLTRACVIAATGKDPGDFTTSNAKDKLVSTGLFKCVGKIVKGQDKSNVKAHKGDILCTITKGHVVIVVDGDSPIEKKSTTESTSNSKYFKKCSNYINSFVDGLNSIGEKSNYDYRKKIAKKNGIISYSGSSSENVSLLTLLKKGKLVKP